MIKNNVKFNATRFFNASVLSDLGYLPINANGLITPCPFVKIINGSDRFLLFSTDGQTDHFIINPFSNLQFEAQRFSQLPNKIACFAKGTIFYAKTLPLSLAPIGSVFIVSYSQYRN